MPLKTKLLAKNPLLKWYLHTTHLLSSLFKQRALPSQMPKKILLCNIAHLGDVVLASSVIPSLKQEYPDAQMGFLGSS